MWVMVMYDLPVKTKKDRKEYQRFREMMLDAGFIMLQYSVYARPCPSDESAEKYRKHIERHIAPQGQVRIIMFTDKQFSRMQIFEGKKPSLLENQPEQLSFF